jgi:parallel beta-helix repeat protein
MMMKKLMFVLVIAALLVLPFPLSNAIPGSGQAYAQECTELTNNMVITQDTTFCSKTYSFLDKEEDGVIIIGADNIMVDGNGLTLDGKNNSGYGIYLNGYNGVTLLNFNIKNYYYAIRVENADSILAKNNNVWDNGGKGEQYYDINRPLSSAYGGGILVNKTTNSIFDNNAGSGQNVGIDMYESSGNEITNNDFSDNFGWGIRLYASTSNTVSSNRADHVHGCRGAFCSARDTAGILLVYGSHGNTISGNSIIDGGDGFFIGNEHGLPSNNNIIENNDCRYAIHNAIEATFSEGNVFRGNIASNSDYGFWLGFSHHSTVENNTIKDNRTDGIHWEHGRFGTISGNEITGNGRYGLALTLNPNHSLIEKYPGSEASHDYTISQNTLADNGQYGIYFLHTTTSTVQSNVIAGNNINLYFDGDSTDNEATQNDILCTSASGSTCQYSAYNNMDAGKDVNAEYNWWGTDVESEIDALVFDGRDDPAKGLIDYDPWLAPERHDVAVIDIAAPSWVVVGDPVPVDVAVENQGTYDESFTVTLTDTTDNKLIGSQDVTLAAGASTTVSFSWDTTNATVGDHTLEAEAVLLTDEDTADNSMTATVTVKEPSHDVAVTAIDAPSTVGQGDPVFVDVTVENQGTYDESFTVTLTDTTDNMLIGSQDVILAAGASTTLSFSWDTTNATIGDHVLEAVASTVEGETDTADNSLTTTVNVVEKKALYVAIALDRDPPVYTRGETVYITATVTDGTYPVEGATVHITILTPRPISYGWDQTTDANGVTIFEFTPKWTGEYTTWADASKEGYDSGSSDPITFTVN